MKLEYLEKLEDGNWFYKPQKWTFEKNKKNRNKLIIFNGKLKIYDNSFFSKFWDYYFNLPIMKQSIYCCECNKEIEAELCFGFEIYPNRTDLFEKLFYKCPHCNNYVGVYERFGAKKPFPLGKIVNSNIKKLRIDLHNNYIDPIWQTQKKWTRTEVYNYLFGALKEDHPYHTANVCTIEDYELIKNKIINLRKILLIN